MPHTVRITGFGKEQMSASGKLTWQDYHVPPGEYKGELLEPDLGRAGARLINRQASDRSWEVARA